MSGWEVYLYSGEFFQKDSNMMNIIFLRNLSLTINCFYYSEQYSGTWNMLSIKLAHFLNIVQILRLLLQISIWSHLWAVWEMFLEICYYFSSLWGDNKYSQDVCDYDDDWSHLSPCVLHISLSASCLHSENLLIQISLHWIWALN